MDVLFAELIVGQRIRAAQKREILLRRKGQQIAALGADRAIARHQCVDRHLDVEADISAMTAAAMFHGSGASFLK